MRKPKHLKSQDVLNCRDLPKECINDLTVPGQDAEEAAIYWVKKLNFSVEREDAINYIKSTGAHTREELVGTPELEEDDPAYIEPWDDDRLARWVLWMAATDIKEVGLFVMGV